MEWETEFEKSRNEFEKDPIVQELLKILMTSDTKYIKHVRDTKLYEMKTITPEEVFQDDTTITRKVTFANKAHNQLWAFYVTSWRMGLHSLNEAEFLGWLAIVGYLALNTRGKK